MKMYPRAPSPGIHGGAVGTDSPDYVGVTMITTRPGEPRFDSAGERPASCRRVAADRSGRARSRWRKRARSRPQQGVFASDTSRFFGTTPCGSPRLGLFSTSAHFQAEIETDSFTSSFSFAVLAGTKYAPARRDSKQSRSGTTARAGPAPVETSGLAQKDSSPNWSRMMPGTNPLT